MTYAGLTISDKPALLEAQKNGHTYIYLNHDGFRTVYNVNLALAQIAEMESAEKNPIGCEYCSGIETVIRESAYGKFYLLKDAIGGWCVKVNHTKCPPFGGCALKDMIINHLCKIKFCPMCGRDLNSPYTEGEKK